MWEIKDGTKLIARGSNIHAENGFLSENEDYLQFAVLRLPDGDELQPHIHKQRERQGEHPTHEFFIVWDGELAVTFYDDKKVPVDCRAFAQGDFFCQYSGGHSFKSTSPYTLFIEVKHGPFVGVEDDKIKF